MKNFFMFMAGSTGRYIRGGIGFALIAWGYSSYQYPANVVLMVAGTVVLLAAVFNISILAPLFGYPLMGNRTGRKYGHIEGVPGEHGKAVPTNSDGVKNPSTTTQGGSNHGQGSMQLGGEAYKQGSEKSDGSNYANEQDFKEV